MDLSYGACESQYLCPWLARIKNGIRKRNKNPDVPPAGCPAGDWGNPPGDRGNLLPGQPDVRLDVWPDAGRMPAGCWPDAGRMLDASRMLDAGWMLAGCRPDVRLDGWLYIY